MGCTTTRLPWTEINARNAEADCPEAGGRKLDATLMRSGSSYGLISWPGLGTIPTPGRFRNVLRLAADELVSALTRLPWRLCRSHVYCRVSNRGRNRGFRPRAHGEWRLTFAARVAGSLLDATHCADPERFRFADQMYRRGTDTAPKASGLTHRMKGNQRPEQAKGAG